MTSNVVNTVIPFPPRDLRAFIGISFGDFDQRLRGIPDIVTTCGAIWSLRDAVDKFMLDETMLLGMKELYNIDILIDLVEIQVVQHDHEGIEARKWLEGEMFRTPDHFYYLEDRTRPVVQFMYDSDKIADGILSRTFKKSEPEEKLHQRKHRQPIGKEENLLDDEEDPVD